jgi:hypothetical protein
MSSSFGPRPRLILHIGAPKTGSSAIQWALAAGAGQMKELGILVPDAQLGAHGEVEGQQVFFVEQSMQQPDMLVAAIERLRLTDMPKGELRAVVISAENLIERGQRVAPKLASLNAFFDVKVVAYVRSQDDLLASAWQQWYCKVHTDLWAWVISEVGRYGDWWAQLQPWLEAFGRERMDVRIYPPREHHDSIRDFFEASGLPLEVCDLLPGRSDAINPSFNSVVQALAEGNEGLFASAHDNEFFETIHSLLGDAVRKRPGEHLFGVRQRSAILQRYRRSNEQLRTTFFSDTPAPLFPDPPADATTAVRRRPVTVEELREEVDMLTKLFFAMYRQAKPPS